MPAKKATHNKKKEALRAPGRKDGNGSESNSKKMMAFARRGVKVGLNTLNQKP
jgi:hypothetical protein